MTIKVDLKSQEVKRGFTFDYGWVVLLFCILAAAVGFLFYGNFLESEAKKEETKVKQNEVEIAKYASIKPAIERLQQEVSAIQGQISQMKELRYDSLKYAVLLSNFTTLLPSSIWVENFSLEPGRNTITFAAQVLSGAESPPLKAIAEMMRNFQNSPYYGGITVSNIAEKKGAITTYSLNVEAVYRLSIAELKGSERP